MRHQLPEFPWFVLLISIVAGMVGGCGSAAFQILSRRQLSFAIGVAYVTLGGTIGGAAMLILFIFAAELGIDKIMLISMALGAFASVAVAGIRLGARVILRWRNFEAEIVMRRLDAGDCGNDETQNGVR